MKLTDLTLLEQMHFSDFELEHLKALFSFTAEDEKILPEAKATIEKYLNRLVDDFYKMQTSIPEIALLIGDADTLTRLRNAQRLYIQTLFDGIYDLDYVNNRLRIGLIHKRIGVEPKLFLSAVQSLKKLLNEIIEQYYVGPLEKRSLISALEKLIMLDTSLVFDAYIRSMVVEIKNSKQKCEQYARSMEIKVKERTQQLEKMSLTDPLTGLLNFRLFDEIVTKALRSAQRRAEPVSVVYLDIDNFKQINDSLGHEHGNQVLRNLGQAIKNLARIDDSCFRYGGDEFCIILSKCTETQAQEIFVNRLQEALNLNFENVSVSMGVAQTGPSDFLEASALIALADEQMYRAKQAKHNQHT
ncbi:GGDEF domain-containing protein [bacterium (Candidatus Blackallbacteria) CG17_big_fil_post_rev_8_21_14_2_50_48_46]|uniref:Diguanylate cyclase DosC n=1 Tax=bacterium (Candidatus Blackallbacteria) CG17_big_fil_post_rev_8_21_14_2_50_48_46 TaxID=2014261 RepID=A0A2M7G739_9BACT|nr:MAG: GGDEF domain-containing protein [bacterium (Candidatus Blackallbacteria) CG18_big_fil_WC_8_21_14_2_50_49_26]PIW17872.1 MAG: GGDEF domain-containing protein [bacterium (Candidatus Blackallbacteria) CG17_big_fil_post_rev_8_21_14_2_50_48_46]PIW48548.1 MAG: GGDEF domain-containing protein [bacterium (Candidatus Blackallbacteria) CG13_big_fil_rev_8_21_14_2_50_49_14]